MRKKKTIFMPSAYYKSIADLPIEAYKQAGYSCIFLDIDNTLMPHGRMHADEAAKLAVKRLQQAKFTVYIFSNAVRERLENISRELQIDYVKQAKKPSARALLAFMQAHGIAKEASLVIGDQLITDIWAANKAEVDSILIKPISTKELWHIRLKRKLEAYISKKYGFERYFDWILLEKKPKMR